jgi:hypothetical protein
MTSPIRGTLHGSPSLAGVERLVLMRWMDKMCFYNISCANCLHHTRYFFYIGTYRSYHPTFCTYMGDNGYRGLGCNAFASPSLYWWRRNFNAVVLQYCNNTWYVYAIFIGGNTLNLMMLHQTFKAYFL